MIDTFYTMKKDYIIDIERKKSTFTDSYDMNKITIKNIFNNIILSINLSLDDVRLLFDTYYEFIDSHFTTTNIILNHNDLQFRYIIEFDYNNYSKEINMKIYQNELLRLTIIFNEDYLSEFLDKMYYMFVDII